MINIEQIKQLRSETGVSISECKKALIEAKGDIEKAKEILRKRGQDFAQTKAERKTCEGIVETYIHPNGKIGVMVELCCETDFVGSCEEFRKLAHELCLQIAAMNPTSESSLLAQPWIRDESKAIKDLIDEYIAKIGENIAVKRFARYEI
jgi:elongation factor Ts